MQTSIPLHRVATVIPFMDHLRHAGVPLERELRRARLPVLSMQDPDCFIPSRMYWTFIANMARRKGMEELGFRVGLHSGANAADPGLARRLAKSATLHVALERFCQLASSEISRVALWLEPADNKTHRLNYRTSYGSEHPACVHFQWYGLMATMAAIRLFAGRRWQPAGIGLLTDGLPGRSIRTHFPDTRFHPGQEYCFITLDNRMLVKQPRLEEDEFLSAPRYARVKPPADFTGTLKLALRSYLRDGIPSLELAADIAELSSRTLQRRLAEEGLTFRELLDECRYEAAVWLIENTDHNISYIASQVGYTDPSHFSRAFRRVTGFSPREFRKQYPG